MADKTEISWCDATFQPWEGCTKVSDGCKNCYAETRDKRMHGGTHWGPSGTRKMMSESYWQQPLKWNQAAQKEGVRKRVFCASLADVFEGIETMPKESILPVWEARLRLFRLIYETPNLDWLLLTKRPENITYVLSMLMNRAYGVPVVESPFALWMERWLTGVSTPHNAWLGTSVEDQETADMRIPFLLEVPAVVRFLSMEPLLGPVDLTRIRIPLGKESFMRANVLHRKDALNLGKVDPAIDWVIVGGESGSGARPMHPAWARSLRDQCVAAGVPFHLKQWGEFCPVCDDTPMPCAKTGTMISLREGDSSAHFKNDPQANVLEPGRVLMWRAGKKEAGRLLDGRTWDEFPTTETEEAR